MEKSEKTVMVYRDHLEQNATKSERRFMQFLLQRKMPFQFQKMLRGYSGRWYIADFYLHDFRVVIEIDGDYHRSDDTQYVKDRERTFDLEKFGYKVLRIRNRDTGLPPSELAAIINRKYANYVPSIYYRMPERFLSHPPGGSIFPALRKRKK